MYFHEKFSNVHFGSCVLKMINDYGFECHSETVHNVNTLSLNKSELFSSEPLIHYNIELKNNYGMEKFYFKICLVEKPSKVLVKISLEPRQANDSGVLEARLRISLRPASSQGISNIPIRTGTDST